MTENSNKYAAFFLNDQLVTESPMCWCVHTAWGSSNGFCIHNAIHQHALSTQTQAGTLIQVCAYCTVVLLLAAWWSTYAAFFNF